MKCWKDDIKRVYKKSDQTIGKGKRGRERGKKKAGVERTVKLEETRRPGRK